MALDAHHLAGLAAFGVTEVLVTPGQYDHLDLDRDDLPILTTVEDLTDVLRSVGVVPPGAFTVPDHAGALTR
jgi:hypothetical protein